MESELHKAFDVFGTIECIRNIPGKEFAFIKFSTRESAENAISKMNGEMIGNNRVRASRAKTPSSRSRWNHRSYHREGDHRPHHKKPFTGRGASSDTDVNLEPIVEPPDAEQRPIVIYDI